MTNLGLSSLSLPGHTLTTPGSLFVVLSKLWVETRWADGQGLAGLEGTWLS